MQYLWMIMACGAGYLIGAVPAGLLLTRWIKGIDLRTVGSGNPGFTNAARALGWKMGLWVLLFDVLKGFLPAFFLPRWLGLDARESMTQEAQTLIVAVSPIVGHVFSLFLRFRGGKGVATSLGVFLALAPGPMLIALMIGLTVLAMTRYMSLASITGAITMALVASCMMGRERILLVAVIVVIAVLIVWLHRANIVRLKQGTERRFGEIDMNRQSDR